MASNQNVFVNSGFVEDGFFQSLIPTVPVLINLGAPGAAIHALPFRALGGSVADLDVLYGVLGREATIEDIQPFFVLSSRQGLLRYFGFEHPRVAIQDAVIEHYATLLDIEDIVIEGSPTGSNLFGLMGLTTRPQSTVRISNADGYWSTLIMRELLQNSPAGLFIDVAHTTVMGVLLGTVSSYQLESGAIVMSYGFQARRKTHPPTGID